TTTSGRRWPSPTARTFSTTARFSSREPPARSPTIRSPGRSTWAKSSPSRAHGERDVAMAMEARLSIRQSQRVVMTPLLQQAIQLLQLSTLELQEVVQKELLENPLLEEVAPETENAPEAAASPEATATQTTPAEPPPVDAATSTTERQTDDLPFDLTAVMFDDHAARSLVAQEDREELPFENIVRSVNSLNDHL